MQHGDDLTEFTNEAQRKADDASHDHCYVGVSQGRDGEIGALCEPSGEMPSNRARALAFAAVQSVVMHRANGGVGRGVLTFVWTEDALKATWTFWMSPSDAFDAVLAAA